MAIDRLVFSLWENGYPVTAISAQADKFVIDPIKPCLRI